MTKHVTRLSSSNPTTPPTKAHPGRCDRKIGSKPANIRLTQFRADDIASTLRTPFLFISLLYQSAKMENDRGEIVDLYV